MEIYIRDRDKEKYVKVTDKDMKVITTIILMLVLLLKIYASCSSRDAIRIAIELLKLLGF